MAITTQDGFTYKSLSALMEFDHVIRVHPDGSVSDHDLPDTWEFSAPRAWWDGSTAQLEQPAKWSLMSGYGLHSGPVMDPAEALAGQIVTDILTTPGVYVVIAVDVMDCDDSCTAECSGYHDAVGWAVAFRHEKGE